MDSSRKASAKKPPTGGQQMAGGVAGKKRKKKKNAEKKTGEGNAPPSLVVQAMEPVGGCFVAVLYVLLQVCVSA